MKKSSADFKRGISSNGVPYARWGSAEKILFIISGGPGDMLPHKPGMATKIYEPFLNDYSIVTVARKTDLPDGYTTEDIADDCAEMIKSDLGGKVAGVMGISFGGMIMFHFSAKYADLAERHIITMASNRMSDQGKEADMRFAELNSERKPRRAAARIANMMAPKGIAKLVFKALFFLLGSSFVNSSSPTFQKDILIEAKAEINHDASNNIRKISVPVLMIWGDEDYYFLKDSIDETVSLNDNFDLKVYEGKGHMSTMDNKQFAKDVLGFLR